MGSLQTNAAKANKQLHISLPRIIFRPPQFFWTFTSGQYGFVKLSTTSQHADQKTRGKTKCLGMIDSTLLASFILTVVKAR